MLRHIIGRESVKLRPTYMDPHHPFSIRDQTLTVWDLDRNSRDFHAIPLTISWGRKARNGPRSRRVCSCCPSTTCLLLLRIILTHLCHRRDDPALDEHVKANGRVHWERERVREKESPAMWYVYFRACSRRHDASEWTPTQSGSFLLRSWRIRPAKLLAHVSLTDALAYARCPSNISGCIDCSSISRYFCILFDISLLLLLKKKKKTKTFSFFYKTL